MKDEDKSKAQLIDELKAMRQKGAALEAEASARNQTAEELEKQVAALRRSAGTLRTLQTILDSIGDGVVVADENGKFLLWNPAAEQIVGIGPTDTSPDEWTEQYGAFEPDMVTPRPTNEHALVRAIRGEAVDEAEVFLRNPKVPEGIWVSATARPLRDEEGVLRGGVVVFRDVTSHKRAEEALQEAHDKLERRVKERTAELAKTNALLKQEIVERVQAEKALRASETQLHQLMDALPVCISYIDAEQHYNFNNKTYEGWFGLPRAEIQGKHIKEVLGESGYRAIRSYIEAALSGQQVSFEDVVPFKDGRMRYLNATYVPHFGEQGEVRGFFVLSIDTTERKQAEEELQETNRRLEEALAELQAMQQKIVQQERLRAIGQMASGIAHTFNNALTPILGFSELLLNAPGNLGDKEKVMRYLRMINTSAQYTADAVRRLREFYRRRSEDEIFQPVNLNALIEQAIKLTEPKWKNEAQGNDININIKTDLAEVPPILGNEAQLREALTNQIFNAVDALPQGGAITFHTEFDGEYVVLEVSDTGVGMTDEVCQRCFDLFFTTRGERGAGMGLSTVHGIVQRHEGTIDVKSELGAGTTFRIRLPLQTEQQAATRRKEVAASLHPLHVLVVDDEPPVREVVAAYLTGDEHTVETATNGREGLEKFQAERFDLAVVDRAMPEVNGDELAAAIKQVSPNTPVIMLTGFGDLMRAKGEKPANVDHILSKPVTLTAFREVLTKVMASTVQR